MNASSSQSWGVIVPAAGRSSRFGAGAGKLLADLCGATVLERTLNVFLQRADVACVAVALHAQAEELRRVVEAMNDRRLVVRGGGDCRAASVREALRLMPPSIEWVGVHDAARPGVSQALIDRTLAAARKHGAAGPALAVELTIKQATGPLPAPVEQTLPRRRLWAMQTPQIMRRKDLLDAFERCPIPLEQVTDDLQLLELSGRHPWLVEGEPLNIKITRPGDLERLEKQWA